jgi:hypothetical protein
VFRAWEGRLLPTSYVERWFSQLDGSGIPPE